MSVGFFLGIRSSYIDEAQDSAEAYIAAINKALRRRFLPAYEEPAEPYVYVDTMFGRSALDHDSARSIGALANRVTRQRRAPHFASLDYNCYRVAFVPIDFPEPLDTEFSEKLFGDETFIQVGSSIALFREVLESAALLGVPLENGSLSDATAARISEYEPLFPGDVVDPNSDLRHTWLLLHEGVRFSVQHSIALSLAG